VVVAAGAAEGHAEERLAERVDLLVDDVHPHLDLVGFGQDFGSERQEARGDPQVGDRVRDRNPRRIGGGRGCRIGRGQTLEFLLGDQVAGDLFDDELVDRLVSVERADHVVAIPPGVAMGDVFIQTVGIGIASDVQPVPSPMLAVLLGIEQPIDHAGIGGWRIVGQERVDRFRRGGQPGQVVGDAADQRPLVDRSGRDEAARLEFRQDEVIDRVDGPSRVADHRHFRAADRLERPVLLGLFQIDRGFPRSRHRHAIRFGVRGPASDPVLEQRDFVVGQLRVGRHLQRRVLVADR